VREAVLRDLAAKAASDPNFLSGIRKDPERTLAEHGYALTPDELRTVLGLRRRTAALGDRTLAALLAGGLRGRTGNRPVGPPTPGRPGSPGGPEKRRRRGDAR
jgi:hypothetical protein